MKELIAKSYWRSIRRGARAFADIPAELHADVLVLALADVDTGTITQEDYDRLTGPAPAEG